MEATPIARQAVEHKPKALSGGQTRLIGPISAVEGVMAGWAVMAGRYGWSSDVLVDQIECGLGEKKKKEKVIHAPHQIKKI